VIDFNRKPSVQEFKPRGNTSPKTLDFAGMLDESETPETLESPLVLRRKSKAKLVNMLKRQHLRDVLKEIPEPGYTYHLISNGRFDFWTFVPVLVDLLGQVVEFWGSTWTANRSNIQELYDLGAAGKIRKATIQTGLYFKRRETAAWATLQEAIRLIPDWRLRALNTHAKINMLTDGEKNWIVVEGSANWTANPRIEQYTIANDRELYRFHAGWMETAMGPDAKADAAP